MHAWLQPWPVQIKTSGQGARPSPSLSGVGGGLTAPIRVRQEPAGRCRTTARPTIFPCARTSTRARQSQPSSVGTRVRSAMQIACGIVARNCRAHTTAANGALHGAKVLTTTRSSAPRRTSSAPATRGALWPHWGRLAHANSRFEGVEHRTHRRDQAGELVCGNHREPHDWPLATRCLACLGWHSPLGDG